MPKISTYDPYIGTTRDTEPIVETAGPSPGSILVQLSAEEKKLWDNLFRLYDTISPFVDYLDELQAKEEPPEFLTTPWVYVDDDNYLNWGNYSLMRKSYQEAGLELINEYERLRTEAQHLGIEPITVALITVVAVGGAILLKFGSEVIESIKKTPETMQIEAETERLRTHAKIAEDWKKMDLDLDKHLELLFAHDKEVAEDAQITWPFVMEKATNLLKWLAIGGGVLLIWKLSRK